MMGYASQRALREAVAAAARPDVDEDDIVAAVQGAHDSALGLDRSVCLRDVDALRDSMQWLEDDAYADWVSERFAGGRE
jgi:hypothetical protein